jgi:predicted transcriptional regulator
MKTIEIQVPDEIVKRLDNLIAAQGQYYESVNAASLKGRDALLMDVFILGLDELDEGNESFPDDID